MFCISAALFPCTLEQRYLGHSASLYPVAFLAMATPNNNGGSFCITFRGRISNMDGHRESGESGDSSASDEISCQNQHYRFASSDFSAAFSGQPHLGSRYQLSSSHR